MNFSVKTPFVWSTSGYNDPGVVISDSEIPVDAAICRASHGLKIVDSSFPHYWPQWDRLHIPRAAYHFLLNGYDAADQAKFFVKCVTDGGGWKPGDFLILDAEEEAGLSVRAMLDFFGEVHALLPQTVPAEDYLEYSRQNLLNPLGFGGISESERAYLLKIRTWIAGYPNTPDAYTWQSLIASYSPNPLRWGKCVLEQYAAAALVEGLSKPGYLSIECNVIDPTFLQLWQARTAARYGELPPPPPPPTGDAMKNTVTIIWPAGARERTLNSINGTEGPTVPVGTTFQTDHDVVDDRDEPTNPDKKWIQVSDSPVYYIATRYPSSTSGIVRATVTPNSTPPPAGAVPDYVTAHFSDGSTKKFLPEP